MKYAFIDLFCGCGGTTSGIENIPDAFVFCCVNHDKNAILSHKSNHPGALHFFEDIKTVSIQILVDKANEVRRQYPGIKICLWASLECTNHSNAKGGMSRDADSRTLAEHLFRYFPIDFDLIFIENVREFKDWCPLIYKKDKETQLTLFDKKGNPVMVPDKSLKGSDYKNWVENVKQAGYNFEDIIINCADIGCPTTRKRLFIQFAKPGIKIGWPISTHSQSGEGGLKKWPAVGPLLQLEDHGQSIFESRVRAPKTYKRILKGIKKFGITQFLSLYYGKLIAAELNEPSPTLTVKDRCYLTSFMMSEYSDGRYSKLESPAPSPTCVPKEKIVTAQFLASHYGASIGSDMSAPAPALTGNPKQDVVTAQFMMSNYINASYSKLEDPCSTLVTKPQQKVISTHFLMDHQFNNPGSSIENPCPTLIARQDKKPKYLVTSQFLMSTNFNNIGSDLNSPAPTQLASRKYDYLVTADKEGEFSKAIINENDCLELIELKMFMQDHGIVDIKMRPLFLVEMLKIMTFPPDYKLIGTKTEQKKYIGNAVPPEAAEKIVQTSIILNAA